MTHHPSPHNQKCARRRHRPSGMTLVELLLASIMLVIAGIGILGAILQGQTLLEHASNTMRAVNDAEDLMEHIRTTPFDQVQARFPAGTPDGGGVTDYRPIVGGYTLDGEQIVVTYPSQTTGRMEILVTLNWMNRTRSRSTTLSTVRTAG